MQIGTTRALSTLLACSSGADLSAALASCEVVLGLEGGGRPEIPAALEHAFRALAYQLRDFVAPGHTTAAVAAAASTPRGALPIATLLFESVHIVLQDRLLRITPCGSEHMETAADSESGELTAVMSSALPVSVSAAHPAASALLRRFGPLYCPSAHSRVKTAQEHPLNSRARSAVSAASEEAPEAVRSVDWCASLIEGFSAAAVRCCPGQGCSTPTTPPTPACSFIDASLGTASALAAPQGLGEGFSRLFGGDGVAGMNGGGSFSSAMVALNLAAICPTIRLCNYLFGYLTEYCANASGAAAASTASATASASAYSEGAGGCAWTGYPWARVLLDAYVYSLSRYLFHGAAAGVAKGPDSAAAAKEACTMLGSADIHRLRVNSFAPEWIALHALLPPALRLLVELAAPQCSHCPNPDWPNFLLQLVGRDDLCGKRTILTLLVRLF